MGCIYFFDKKIDALNINDFNATPHYRSIWNRPFDGSILTARSSHESSLTTDVFGLENPCEPLFEIQRACSDLHSRGANFALMARVVAHKLMLKCDFHHQSP